MKLIEPEVNRLSIRNLSAVVLRGGLPVAVLVLLVACSGINDPSSAAGVDTLEDDPAPPVLPEIPNDAPEAIPYLEIVLLSDMSPSVDDGTALRMGESTMLLQRLLAAELGLHFDVSVRTEPVLLEPETASGDPDTVSIGDYLHKLREWKAAELDSPGAPWQPHALLLSHRKLEHPQSSAYVGVVGHPFSAGLMAFTPSSFSLSPAQAAALRAMVAARMIGFNLGGRIEDGEAPTIMSPTYLATDPPVHYSSTTIALMSGEIDGAVAQRGSLPSLDVHPAGVRADSGSVTLAWDFGSDADSYTIHRSHEFVPISCFDCDSFSSGQSRSFVDHSVTAGGSYRYRVVARDVDGKISAVSAEITVDVPAEM